MSECFVKKLYKKYIFAWPVESVAVKVSSIFYMKPHMLHYDRLTAAWNNDLYRLHTISFKQHKTLFCRSAG